MTTATAQSALDAAFRDEPGRDQAAAKWLTISETSAAIDVSPA
jgi:hypothetical protein